MKRTLPSPTDIDIGAVRYRVKVTDAAIEDFRDRLSYMGDQLNGAMSMLTSELVINPNLSPGFKRLTMLHEVLHACWAAGGGDALKDKVTQEQAILVMSEALLATLRGNPTLVQYLLGNWDYGAPGRIIKVGPKEKTEKQNVRSHQP